MTQTIIVIDNGQDFNMYPATGLLFGAASITLMLCIFKLASIGIFATAGWWVTGIPFGLCGVLFFLTLLKR
jgi:hypothetical protein